MQIKMTENKMQWLINRVQNGEMENIIAKTGEPKGTIIIPTGGGKSGVVYEDIIKHIQDIKDGEKIIFNLSAPILDLEAQFINDLFSCLSDTFTDMKERGEFMFFINSTAEGDSYRVQSMYSDVNRFYEIDKFKYNPYAKVAVVATCHKSLAKFAEKIDYLNTFATTINYLDEAHLLIHETRDEKKLDEMNQEERVRWDSLNEIFSKSDYVYTLTATEEQSITNELNKFAGKPNRYHIIEISAKDLIKQNIILPVKIYTRIVSDKCQYGITSEICENFMQRVKDVNPYINHKILINCANTDHLFILRNALNERGYKVFSTCSRDGAKSNEEEQFDEINKVEFISEIDSYDGDCFVLHIRRLTQGIDIKSLTDCIYYNTTRVQNGVKRRMIQVLGRILRPANGERGMDIEHRTKKFGYALFVIKEKDEETVKRQMINNLVDYYGTEGIDIFSEEGIDHGETGKHKNTIGDGNFGDEYVDLIDETINAIKVNIAEYTKVKLIAHYNFRKQFDDTLSITEFVDDNMNELKLKFMHSDEDIDFGELISDSQLMDFVSDILRRCLE